MKSTDVENLQNTVIQWKTVYTIQTKNMLNQIKQRRVAMVTSKVKNFGTILSLDQYLSN